MSNIMNAEHEMESHVPIGSGFSALKDSQVSPTCLSGLPCLGASGVCMLGVVDC